MSVDVEHRDAPPNVPVADGCIVILLKARSYSDRVAACDIVGYRHIPRGVLAEGRVEEIIYVDVPER